LPQAFVVPSFNGLRVLSFESRRRTEMAALISNYGGQPISAPALREVPIESNSEAVAFVDALTREEIDRQILHLDAQKRTIECAIQELTSRREATPHNG